MPDTPAPTPLNPQDVMNLIAAAKLGLQHLSDGDCEMAAASITRVRKALTTPPTPPVPPKDEEKPNG